MARVTQRFLRQQVGYDAAGAPVYVTAWRCFDRTGTGEATVVGDYLDTRAQERPAGFAGNGCIFVRNDADETITVNVELVEFSTGRREPRSVAIRKGDSWFSVADVEAATASLFGTALRSPTTFDIQVT